MLRYGPDKKLRDVRELQRDGGDLHMTTTRGRALCIAAAACFLLPCSLAAQSYGSGSARAPRLANGVHEITPFPTTPSTRVEWDVRGRVIIVAGRRLEVPESDSTLVVLVDSVAELRGAMVAGVVRIAAPAPITYSITDVSRIRGDVFEPWLQALEVHQGIMAFTGAWLRTPCPGYAAGGTATRAPRDIFQDPSGCSRQRSM